MPEVDSFFDLVIKNRSYRKFDESASLTEEFLKELVFTARHTASAGNLQPLRYRLVFDQKEKEILFKSLSWAAYLKDFEGPEKGNRPGGYIIMLRDLSSIGNHYMFDAGISAQTILLDAVSKGFGGCMIASFNKNNLVKDFEIDENFEPVLVIAIGKPAEKCIIEDVNESGVIKYYRDSENIHHVPKIKLNDLLI
ncbi:MAG: nitroreductase family protein [Desulfobacteraceae bacterium]|nr:nitroreductase family protein [Desulfobacteraceae bacterium]